MGTGLTATPILAFLGLGPAEILVLAVLVGLALGGITYLRGKTTNRPPRPDAPSEPEEYPPADPSWRDKVVFPIIVSVVSSVLTAVILALFGLKK
jgi:hypothetical protein